LRGSYYPMKKSTFLHLRIPFSFFLSPVFFFATAIVSGYNTENFWLVFIILHFLLYPASNGYNSYFDKDEGSIGGLKHPPKVTQELFYASWAMDVLAIGLGWSISWQFAVMLLVYGLVSKAYSHPSIRLKKMPIIGWLAAGIFQGYFTFLMVCLAFSGPEVITELKVQYAGILSTLLLFGSYPMTQVYQHDEDARRGDRTISLILGVLGTFHFTALFFSVSVLLFAFFFQLYYDTQVVFLFILALSPILLFFLVWYMQVRKDLNNADYQRTMWLNFISGACLNIFFIWLIAK